MSEDRIIGAADSDKGVRRYAPQLPGRQTWTKLVFVAPQTYRPTASSIAAEEPAHLSGECYDEQADPIIATATAHEVPIYENA